MRRTFKLITAAVASVALLFCSAFAQYEFVLDDVAATSDGRAFLSNVYSANPDVSKEDINQYFYTFIDNVMLAVAETAKNNADGVWLNEVYAIAETELRTNSINLAACLISAYPEATAEGVLPQEFNSLKDVVKTTALNALDIVLLDENTDDPSDTTTTPSISIGGGGYTPKPTTPTTPTQPGDQGERPAPKFEDVNETHSWASEAITVLYKAKIVDGVSEKSFAPDEKVTRAQFAKLCAQAFDLTSDNASCNFGDVPSDSWYYKYVASLTEAGILKGVNESSFGSDSYISREDMAVILDRIYQLKGYSASKKDNVGQFNDHSSLEDYSVDAVYNMRSLGIINGMEDNTYQPKAPATRAQAIQLIYNMYVIK